MFPFFWNVNIDYALFNSKCKIQILNFFKGNFNFTLLERAITLWKGWEGFNFERFLHLFALAMNVIYIAITTLWTMHRYSDDHHAHFHFSQNFKLFFHEKFDFNLFVANSHGTFEPYVVVILCIVHRPNVC